MDDPLADPAGSSSLHSQFQSVPTQPSPSPSTTSSPSSSVHASTHPPDSTHSTVAIVAKNTPPLTSQPSIADLEDSTPPITAHTTVPLRTSEEGILAKIGRIFLSCFRNENQIQELAIGVKRALVSYLQEGDPNKVLSEQDRVLLTDLYNKDLEKLAGLLASSLEGQDNAGPLLFNLVNQIKTGFVEQGQATLEKIPGVKKLLIGRQPEVQKRLSKLNKFFVKSNPDLMSGELEIALTETNPKRFRKNAPMLKDYVLNHRDHAKDLILGIKNDSEILRCINNLTLLNADLSLVIELHKAVKDKSEAAAAAKEERLKSAKASMAKKDKLRAKNDKIKAEKAKVESQEMQISSLFASKTGTQAKGILEKFDNETCELLMKSATPEKIHDLSMYFPEAFQLLKMKVNETDEEFLSIQVSDHVKALEVRKKQQTDKLHYTYRYNSKGEGLGSHRSKNASLERSIRSRFEFPCLC